MDTYVAAWFFVEVFCLIGTTRRAQLFQPLKLLAWVVLILVGFHVLEILASAIRAALFDRDILPPCQQPVVSSHARMVVIGFVNYTELVVCFASFYAVRADLVRNQSDWFDTLYLSAICQLTVGFGDVFPTKELRLVSMLQAFISLLVLVLLIGRYVAMLRPEASLEDRADNSPEVLGTSMEPKLPPASDSGPVEMTRSPTTTNPVDPSASETPTTPGP